MMPVKRELDQLSERTRQMLAATESVNVDFKRDASGIKSADLVALANAAGGGTLLVGVEEYTAAEGVQRGRVVGCEVDDNARLILINKATECYPSIDLQLFVENVQDKPVMRIEIASGPLKPYCTPRGEYTIRAEGRNRALYPEELLLIFMDREGEKFLHRFRTAFAQLEFQVDGINQALSQDMEHVADHIRDLDQQLEKTLGRLIRLADSSKKRSRNLLQSLRDSQQRLDKMEHHLSHPPGCDGADQDIYQRLEQKIDQLLARQDNSV